jgi:heptaprenyl diphosphate synthase
LKRLQTSRDDHRIAWLTALAITIHIAESALPSPLPGLKPGLANIITVVVLVRFGWGMAAWVSLLRVIAGSLLLGTFLSPTFTLSLSGAIAAMAALWLVQWLPGRGCSAFGFSIVAALSHMSAQFWCAYLLFIPHPGMLHLWPPLLTAALIFGLINGWMAHLLLTAEEQYRAPSDPL